MDVRRVVVIAAILAVPGLSACASATMTASAPDLSDACVVRLGEDGRPKRVEAPREPFAMERTVWLQNREVKVRRVFGSRIVLRGRNAASEPGCAASGAPNIG